MMLSACLIIRNEERCLDQCLSSIRPFIDEIIVVDTGSTDKSLDIAKTYGARLSSFPWVDDFAAARNEALKQARGEWVLSIDADETLRPLPSQELKNILQDPEKVAYRTLISPGPGWTEMTNLRLFRRHPLVKYRGTFHESLWEGLRQRIEAGGGKIGNSRIVFDHRGAGGPEKNERNIPLLLKELAASPESTWHRQHLAAIYLESGRKEEAEELWEENIRIIRQKTGQADPGDSLSYIGLLQFMLQEDRDAFPLLEEALTRFPGNPQICWLRGKALMKARRYVEAFPCFDRLIQWGIDRDYDRSLSYRSGLFAEYAYEALAACHFHLGHYQAGRRYFEDARKCDPHNMEYAVKARLCALFEKTRPGHPEGY